MKARTAALVLGFMVVAAFAVADGVTYQAPRISDESTPLAWSTGLNFTGSGLSSCIATLGNVQCLWRMNQSQGALGEVQFGNADGGYAGGKTFKISADGFPNFSALKLDSTFQGDGGMLSMLGRQYAGKPVVGTQIWGASASPVGLQDGLSSIQHTSVSATGTLGTLSQVGITPVTAGTEVTIQVSGADGQSIAKRNAYTTGTGSSGNAEVYSTNPVGWRGNDAGLGGFFCSWDFFLSYDGGYMTTATAFVGLSATNTTIVSANYSSNLEQITAQLSSGAWRLCSNDDAGTASCLTNCGAAFDGGVDSNTYRLSIYAAPADTKVGVELRRIDATAKNADVVCSATILNDLPAPSSFLRPHASIGNGALGGVMVLNFLRQYCQVPQ